MRRVALAIAVVVLVALSVTVPGFLFDLARRATDSEAEVPLDVLEPVDEGIAELARPPAERFEQRIAYLGDSIIASHRDVGVPARLQDTLDGRTRKGLFRICAVAAPGLGPFDFYFLADRVADARPDQVILPINLTVFSRPWRATFSRPQLAGILPARRLPQALALPLEWIGLTADRLLGYFAVVHLGGLDAWTRLSREQVRLGAARRSLANHVGARFGDGADRRFDLAAYRYFAKKFEIPKTNRLTREAIEDRYDRVLHGIEPDEPTLEVLAATLRIFRDAGIDVLVYANPTNVEHMARMGVVQHEGIDHTIRSLRQVATANGARFLDLHELLPDKAFGDAAGHLDFREGSIDAAWRLADGVAPVLIQTAYQRGAR